MMDEKKVGCRSLGRVRENRNWPNVRFGQPASRLSAVGAQTNRDMRLIGEEKEI